MISLNHGIEQISVLTVFEMGFIFLSNTRTCDIYVVSCIILQVGKPNRSPIVLKGHRAEVSDVAWSPKDLGKVNMDLSQYMHSK